MSRQAIKIFHAAIFLAALFVVTSVSYVAAGEWSDYAANPDVIGAWEKFITNLGLGVTLAVMNAGALLLALRYVLVKSDERDRRHSEQLAKLLDTVNKLTIEHAMDRQRWNEIQHHFLEAIEQMADEISGTLANMRVCQYKEKH